MAEQEDRVQRIRAELLHFNGCLLTEIVRQLVGPMIWLQAPKLSVEAIFGALSIDGVRGKVITEELADERARAIARLVIS